MSYRFVLIVVITLTGFSSASARDEVSLPGDPPEFFIVTAVNKDGLVIQRRPPSSKLVDVPNIVYKPAFKTLRATDAKGKKLTADDVTQRVKPGSVVLVSPDDRPIEPVFLTVLKDETLILLDIIPPKGATGIKSLE